MVYLLLRNARNKLTIALCLFVLCVTGTARASTASENLVNEGGAILFNAGNPMYSAVVPAHAKFEAAVQDDPTDQTARFFYAFSGILSFLLADGDASGLDNLAEFMSAIGAGRSSYDLVSGGPPYDIPLTSSGELDLAETSPTGAQTQAFLAGPFLTAISDAVSQLDVIENTWGTTLTSAETGDAAVEIDYGDVLLMKSALAFMKSIISLTSAYNLDLDLRGFIALMNAGVFKMQRDMLDAYVDLFKLKPEGGTQALGDAKSALLNGIDLFESAIAFIDAEADDQSNDLIYFGDFKDRVDAERVLNIFQEARQSLNENRAAAFEYTKKTWQVTDSNGKMATIEIETDWTGDVLNIDVMALLDLSWGPFWAEAEVTGWSDNGVTLTTNYNFRHYGIPCDYSSTGNESGGVIDVTCDGQEPQALTYTCVLQTTDVDSFTIDLNKIFGNTGKSALDIRAILPGYYWCNRAVPGSFPPTDDGSPVLNGILPDFVTNADLTLLWGLEPCEVTNPVSVSGNVQCSECSAGNIFMQAFDGPDIYSARMLEGTFRNGPGAYQIDGFPVGSTVYLFAFRDADGNGVRTDGDYSVKSGPHVVGEGGIIVDLQVPSDGQAPTVSITPLSGPQGLTFASSGSGFTANSTATIYIENEEWNFHAAVAQEIDASGAFSGSLNSSGILPGVYTIWMADGITGAASNRISGEITDASLDTDWDGLTDGQEIALGTDFTKADTDNDGMPDGWEVTYSLDPLSDDRNLDKDNDGWSNLDEYEKGTNPNDSTSRPFRPMPFIPLLLGD
ncbi:MAG: hypothetical protein AB2L11_01825 [Syntrophobacteraceae bacterium]